MTQQICITVSGLSSAPLDAAADFQHRFLPELRNRADKADVVVHLPFADHTHKSWRLAVIQELAREAAPSRVNAVVGEAGQGMSDALDYLAKAPGVTGQILELDGNSDKLD